MSDMLLDVWRHTELTVGVLVQVVAVYGSLEDLLSVASSKLGVRASSVYNGNGGLIDDITLIRWDEREQVDCDVTHRKSCTDVEVSYVCVIVYTSVTGMNFGFVDIFVPPKNIDFN